MRTNNMIFLLIISTMVSCNLQEKDKSKSDGKSSKIIVRNPYGCVNVIEFNENGFGKVAYGSVSSTNNSYNEEFKGLDQVVKESDFKIDSKKDLDSLNLIVEETTNKGLEKNSRVHDAYRFELFVVGTKRVDMYKESETINHLLGILSKHFPFKVDYTCEH